MEFTAGRTDSARALSNQELRELCEGLNVGRAIGLTVASMQTTTDMAHVKAGAKQAKQTCHALTAGATLTAI